MTLKYLGQQPCQVFTLPLRNPVTDLDERRAEKRRQVEQRRKAAEELRLLSERDPEFTNPDTERRLRACLPNTSDEDRGVLFSRLVDYQDKVCEHDGDPEVWQEYEAQIGDLIDCALRADAEAAGR